MELLQGEAKKAMANGPRPPLVNPWFSLFRATGPYLNEASGVGFRVALCGETNGEVPDVPPRCLFPLWLDASLPDHTRSAIHFDDVVNLATYQLCLHHQGIRDTALSPVSPCRHFGWT